MMADRKSIYKDNWCGRSLQNWNDRFQGTDIRNVRAYSPIRHSHHTHMNIGSKDINSSLVKSAHSNSDNLEAMKPGKDSLKLFDHRFSPPNVSYNLNETNSRERKPVCQPPYINKYESPRPYPLHSNDIGNDWYYKDNNSQLKCLDKITHDRTGYFARQDKYRLECSEQLGTPRANNSSRAADEYPSKRDEEFISNYWNVGDVDEEVLSETAVACTCEFVKNVYFTDKMLDSPEDIESKDTDGKHDTIRFFKEGGSSSQPIIFSQRANNESLINESHRPVHPHEPRRLTDVDGTQNQGLNNRVNYPPSRGIRSRLCSPLQNQKFTQNQENYLSQPNYI